MSNGEPEMGGEMPPEARTEKEKMEEKADFRVVLEAMGLDKRRPPEEEKNVQDALDNYIAKHPEERNKTFEDALSEMGFRE